MGVHQLLSQGIRLGGTYRTREIKVLGADGKSWANFKSAKRNEVFVFLAIGFEPSVVEETMDPNAALNRMGCFGESEVEEAVREATQGWSLPNDAVDHLCQRIYANLEQRAKKAARELPP